MLRRTALKRTPMHRAPPRRLKSGEPAYLKWIRTLPCLICQRTGRRQKSVTDAHHYGPRGLSTKVPDRQALPLCHVEHHQFGPTAVHQLGRHWAEHHGIDPWAEIARLNDEYDCIQITAAARAGGGILSRP